MFHWYFGRVFITLVPQPVSEVRGDDRATLLGLAADGVPVIAPIQPPPANADRSPLRRAVDGAPLEAPAGEATVLLHTEDAAMRALRQLRLRGTVAGGEFIVAARRGSLEPAAPRGLWDAVMRQLAHRRLARDGRRRIAAWDGR